MIQKIGKKKAIAIIFVSVMVLSGIGISGFSVLSRWNPAGVWASPPAHEGNGNKVIPFVGTGGGESETAGSSNNVEFTGSISESTFDVGQSGTWSFYGGPGNHCDDSNPNYLHYQGSEVYMVKCVYGGSESSLGSYTRTFSSAGSKCWYVSDTFGSSGKAYLTINADPSVTGISFSPSSIDVGQSTTLTACISGGSSPYTYTWSESGAAGQFSSTTASNPTWTSSGTGTATFSVSITDASGESASGSGSLTVLSDPSISISASHNPSDAGQSIDFSTSASGGSGSYTSYSYILYDGTSTSDSQLASGSTSSFSYTFSSSGSYLLKYSVTDSNGCTSSASLTQTVNSDPTVSISSSQNPTDTGKTVEFTSSASGGTPGYSYSWSVNGNTYSSKDINVSFSSSGSYSVQLTVTDAAGYSVSKTLTETVNSDPTVSASSNVSSADVNYPVEFSSTPSGGTGSYSYSWTLNGQQISTSQDFSYSFSSVGTYTLTVTITDSVGVQSSASVTVKINPNPSVSISSSQNPADVGNSVTFSSSESGGTGTDTYVWYINGVQESTASSFSYSFSAAGTYYVNVTVTDSDGHTASYSLKETVNPDPSVVIHVVHNPTDVGIWANFSASIAGGTGPFSYSWTINGESFTTAYVNYTFTASGTFPISLTVADANGNTATASVNEVVNPDPTVAAEAQYSTVDQGINDTFYADVSGGTSPFNYT